MLEGDELQQAARLTRELMELDAESRQRRFAAEEVSAAVRDFVVKALRRHDTGGDSSLGLGVSQLPGARAAWLERISGRSSEDRTLGDYRLIREIGRGGMGVVYEAEQLPLGRRVALKILNLPMLLQGKAPDLAKEASAMARINHPGIVPIYAAGEVDGVAFLAMELVEGRSLDEEIRRLREEHAEEPKAPRRFRWAGGDYFRDVAHFVATIAEALEAAHQQGIIHRDIKPQNILIGSDGQPRLVDFGLAKDLDAATRTATDLLAGTPWYMSPEQIAPPEDGPVDARTDVYSLGVVLYELLTLSRPYEEASSPVLFSRILKGSPPHARRVDPSVPLELDRICRRAMRRQRRDRYDDAGVLSRDLRSYLNETITTSPAQSNGDLPVRKGSPGLIQLLLVACGSALITMLFFLGTKSGHPGSNPPTLGAKLSRTKQGRSAGQQHEAEQSKAGLISAGSEATRESRAEGGTDDEERTEGENGGQQMPGGVRDSLSSRLLAFFDFDDVSSPLTDVSSNDVGATADGDAKWSQDGWQGGAYRFVGSGAVRVELDINPWTFVQPSLTIGAWARVEALTGMSQAVLSADNAVCDRAIVLESRGKRPDARWTASAGSCPTALGSPARTGEWAFLCAVYDRSSGTLRFFTDGRLIFEAPSDNRTSLEYFEIGRNPGWHEEAFRGSIDNVFVFRGTLTEHQIRAIHAGGKEAILATEPDTRDYELFEHDGFLPQPGEDEWILPVATGCEAPGVEWKYTTARPSSGWEMEYFPGESRWSMGPGGFGNRGHLGQWEMDCPRAEWAGPLLFLRKRFELTQEHVDFREEPQVALWGRWTGKLRVYLNGELAVETSDLPDLAGHPMPLAHRPVPAWPWRHRYLPIAPEAARRLRVGENTIAVSLETPPEVVHWKHAFLDLGIARFPLEALPVSIGGFGQGFLATAARRFAEEHQVPTLSYAVSREGESLAWRTIGHLDKSKRDPAPVDSYFRIGDLADIFVKAALRAMIAAESWDPVTGGTLTLDDSRLWPIVSLWLPLGQASRPDLDPLTLGELLDSSSSLPWPSREQLRALQERRGDTLEPADIVREVYLASAARDAGHFSNDRVPVERLLLAFFLESYVGDLESYLEEELFEHSSKDASRDPLVRAHEDLDRRHPNEPWYLTRQWPAEHTELKLAQSRSFCATAKTLADYFSVHPLTPGRPFSDAQTDRLHEDGRGYGAWAWVEQRATNGSWDEVTSVVVLTNQDDVSPEPLVDEIYRLLDD